MIRRIPEQRIVGAEHALNVVDVTGRSDATLTHAQAVLPTAAVLPVTTERVLTRAGRCYISNLTI